MAYQKTSLLVNRQVPEFIRDEYPLFVTFLEAYYRYLETQQGTEINDLISKSKDLRYVADVDSSIDSFETHFFNTFAELVPRDAEISKDFLIKNVLPLYLSKGNEQAFKLLFRLLYNDEVTITLPKDNIIRASDGKWNIDNVLKIDTNIRSSYVGDGANTTFYLAQVVNADEIEVYVDNVLQTEITDYNVRRETRKIIFNTAPSSNSDIKVYYSNFDIAQLNNRKIIGSTSGASAIVERAVPRIITDRLNFGLPFELFINSKTLIGTFVNGEEITTNVVDDAGNIINLIADTFSILTKINVIRGGTSYNVGDPVTILGGGASTGAAAEVETVSDGYTSGIVVVYGGSGFKVASLVESANISGGTIIVGAVDSVNTANPNTANTFVITDDVIGSYESVTIDSGDYGFPSSFTENVDTRIVDALTPLVITDLGPITNVAILFSNTSINTSSLDSQGAIYQAGNNFFDIKSFKSIGRIDINDPGLDYEVGDEVIFGPNPTTTFGYGAAAAVKTVNLIGGMTSIEIQPPRIDGTVNIQNNSIVITGSNTLFEDELNVGDKIVIRSQERYINAITSNTSATVNVAFKFTGGKTWANNSKVGSFSKGVIGGSNYVQGNFPTLTISSNNGTNGAITITSLIGDGETVGAYSNTPAGVIQSIKLTSGGIGYQYIPEVDLSAYGDGNAVANAQIGASYNSFPGRWLTSDSILSSSERRIQGNDYYIEYSYVTESLTEFSKYKNVLKRLLHPAGFVNYSTLNKESQVEFGDSEIDTSTQNTISGLVSIDSTIFITGGNTKFNLANQLSIMTVGSNVAVNGEIRTINSIISNTNVEVSSAFTSNASAQTLIILT